MSEKPTPQDAIGWLSEMAKCHFGFTNMTYEQQQDFCAKLTANRNALIELREVAARSVEFCADGIMDCMNDNDGEFEPETDSGCEHNSSCDTCVAYPLVKLLFGETIAREQTSIREAMRDD